MYYYFIKQETHVRDEFNYLDDSINYLLRTNIALFDGRDANVGTIYEEIDMVGETFLKNNYTKLTYEQFDVMKDIFEIKEWL